MELSSEFPAPDPLVVAMNAAGIADSFRVARVSDHDGENRYGDIADACGGFIGIAEGFARAGEAMERFRIVVGPDAAWGGELPHVYVAWGAVAQALWDHWDEGPEASVAERALLRLVMARTGDHDEEE